MEGKVNSIESMSASDSDIHQVYSLDGKRQERPQQGINIIDAKKVIIK